MNRLLLILLAGFLLTTATSASAANLKGAFSFTPVVGGFNFDDRQDMDNSLVSGARAGFNITSAIGIEALYDYVHNTDQKTGIIKGISMHRYGGEVLYHFFPESTFVPYIAAGYAGLNFDEEKTKKTVGAIDYGVGAKYFINDRFALRGDVRHIIYSYDRTYNNVEYTIGLHIPFGGVAPDAEPVKTVQKQSVPEATSVATEPFRQKAVEVEAVKPPVTSIYVNPVTIAKGESAILTWESTGTIDCSIEPGIGQVPLTGSLNVTPEIDTTYTLTCSGLGGSAISQLARISVNMLPPAVQAAETGNSAPVTGNSSLPVQPEVTDNKIHTAEFPSLPVIKVLFDFNRATIKPKYYDELKKVGNFLLAVPTAKITIQGHSDNVGSKRVNRKISQLRAEKGRSYIIRKFGINGSRIATEGLDYSHPVASNKTRKGKKLNRRIEVKPKQD